MSITSKTVLSWWDRMKLYFPFRKNFILFLGFGLLLLVEKQELLGALDEHSVFLRRSVLDFLVDFFFQVWAVMVILGLTACFLAFYYNRTRIQEENNFSISETYEQNTLTTILDVKIQNLMRPFLGSLGIIFGIDQVFTPIQYFQKKGSQKYNLSYVLDMPFVKKYHFNNAFLVHQDIFGFFRIVLPKTIYKSFTQRAVLIPGDTEPPPHSQAHDEELESEHIQRVKGEWLKYKIFEPSDDMRRIIWRVYAQSRELVIREQENFSPYTSTVSFYISFLNEYKSLTNNPWISDYFLTKYKNASWTIFYNLKKREGLNIKYLPDQRMTGLEAESPLEHDHEIMSISEWVSNPGLQGYVKERESFILCITPLISTSSLSTFLKENPKAMFYLVLPTMTKVTREDKKLDLRKFIYRKPTGIEERNLRFYKFMGQHKEYQKLVVDTVSLLEETGVNYIKIEV